MAKEKRGSFSGQFGFVIAAAGSAVGVGNIWRFPYLAARDGGGLFLIIYLILVLTFGFTLLVSDIAIGRKTRKSSIYAYAMMRPNWKFLGILTFIVPVLIMTYYSVIGGWITKYIAVYLTGAGQAAAGDSYFTDFITSPVSPAVFGLIFMIITAVVVYAGVDKGIERCSRFMMPVLFVLIIGIAIFALTLKHTGEDGVTRTGLQGFVYYLKPSLDGVTPKRFFQILLDAMGQLFFSLSVSMGIMITYGSYVKKDVDLNRSVEQIEFFDTLVAFLAGMMIIPSIYVFSGLDGMNAGPSLIFISLPKVFAAMGSVGPVIAVIFFVMAAFAALTSCVSVLETIVSNVMELSGKSRHKVTAILTVVYCAATVVVSLGYSLFYFDVVLPNGAHAQLLDIMDYISNNALMPVISLLSTILIGWIVTPDWVAEEMEYGGKKFHRKKLYYVMIRFVCPVMMLLLSLQSIGILPKILG
ncbi:MAG: sodium-dependent transporter [Bilifractor sp.]|jgi:NSS family neurotransmitter:Na+ symporter